MARGILIHRDSEPPPVTEPYLWHPALDLLRVPWHVGALSAQAPQFPIQTPAAPVTTRQVTVHTVTNFNIESAIAGTEITVGTGWASTANAMVNASDIDIIVPPSIAVGPILLDPFGVGVRQRVRVRGTTPGSHSGGKVGQFRDNANCTDIIIDGIDMDGSGFSGAESNVCLRPEGTRYAIVNVRALSSGNIWLGHAKHAVVAGCSMFHGAATRAENGFVEGWGIRNTDGSVVVFDSQIRGGRYHNIRLHSNNETGEEYCWCADSDLISMCEARTGWLWHHSSAPSTTVGIAAIVDNCRVYTHSDAGCDLPRNLDAFCEYSRVRNCAFHGAGAQGVYDQAYLDSEAAGAGGTPGDHDWNDGNTFPAFTSLPAWRGPGDPTAIGLPNGMTFQEGEGICPVGP